MRIGRCVGWSASLASLGLSVKKDARWLRVSYARRMEQQQELPPACILSNIGKAFWCGGQAIFLSDLGDASCPDSVYTFETGDSASLLPYGSHYVRR